VLRQAELGDYQIEAAERRAKLIAKAVDEAVGQNPHWCACGEFVLGKRCQEFREGMEKILRNESITNSDLDRALKHAEETGQLRTDSERNRDQRGSKRGVFSAVLLAEPSQCQ